MPDPDRRAVAADAGSTQSLAHLAAVFARAEFKAPVEAISGLVALLVEDCGVGLPDELRSDAEKMRAAASRLTAIVSTILDPDAAGQHPDDQGPEAYASVLRHELRTPITALLGYGELLAEENAAQTHAENGLLSDILDAARRMLGQIDAMVAFVRGDGKSGRPNTRAATDPRPDLKGPIKAIRSVLQGEQINGPKTAGRILVVDDNDSTLDLLSRFLTREGHQVTTLSSGEAALNVAMPSRFDLMLIDLLMPGLSGIDVLRAIKQDPERAVLPVVVISALDEIEGTARCIEAGADDYLTKPIDTVLLRARVGATLERKLLRDREQAITEQLRAEQARSESLLRNVLPASVVERLRKGETVIADQFADATILFSDLVGFTALTAQLPPGRVLELLNTIFSRFDHLAAQHGLEKIKTIGDAYMVAGGVPEARPDHALAVAAMALQMPPIVEQVSRDTGQPLAIRIGLHSGPVAAGVIGIDKFIYDVWGDTVNVASRMERHGEPGRVHISAETRAALGPSYPVQAREAIEVKGRGRMETFFLIGS